MSQHPQTVPVDLMNAETKYVYLAVQGLTDEITGLRGDLQEDVDKTSKVVAEAVSEGILAVLRDEEVVRAFWASAFDQLQVQARAKTGEFVLGSIWSAVTKGLMFLALGYLVYLFGGWTALATLWKALFGVGSP